MASNQSILRYRWILFGVIACGLAARMAVTCFGYNYDMDSWFIVAEIARHGGNVYAETDRYNYGPVWSLVLQALDLLAGHRTLVLRYLIAVFLSFVDLGICLFLVRLAGPMAGALFFLNPISILITGYHCQFDNLAILLGLWSVWLFGEDFANPLNARKFAGLLVLGLSLMTKHLLFAFPFWLAVKQKGLRQRLVVLMLPLFVLVVAFVPYLPAGAYGIFTHVFAYRSFHTYYFYEAFVPQWIKQWWNSEDLWYILLTLLAFICRSRSGFHSLLIYTGALVAFAPATANQYLAIPIALAAVCPNPVFFAYTVLGTFQLCLQMPALPYWLYRLYGNYNDVVIRSLCWALFWLLCARPLRRLWQALALEVEPRLARRFRRDVSRRPKAS